MEADLKTEKLYIDGMTCVNCQNRIKKSLSDAAGIVEANVSYSAGNAVVTYDAGVISLEAIKGLIEKLDYRVLENPGRKSGIGRAAGLLFIIVFLYIALEQIGLLNMMAPSELASETSSYGMLFVIGLFTSVHCIAMCGGINLSQCIPRGNMEGGGKWDMFRPSFLYNLGRVISYTGVGFVVGAIGSAITFSNHAQGILKLVAGVFMLIMGINMLNIFPWLRRLNPRMPKFFSQKVNARKGGGRSPLYVGILNGFMPCGPLQAMQIYALSTGNPVSGAISMFLFSVGTTPLMFGLGSISTALGKKFTQKAMVVGAVLVAVLGLSMLTQGLSLYGVNFDPAAGIMRAFGRERENEQFSGEIADGVQIVRSTLTRSRYADITIAEGIPVKWIYEAPQGTITGCNDRFFINEYGIEHAFTQGENIIEFTPARAGRFQYVCWMGMMRAAITVVGTGGVLSDDAFSDLPELVPAGVLIPTDEIVTAKKETDEFGDYQAVTIELTDNGFSPAVIVAEEETMIELIVVNRSKYDKLLVPVHAARFDLGAGENMLHITPWFSFDFSTADNAFYGYVKVADDLNSVDYAAIKREVDNFETMIWPDEVFIYD